MDASLQMPDGADARILKPYHLTTAGEPTHGNDPKVGCEEVRGKEGTRKKSRVPQSGGKKVACKKCGEAAKAGNGEKIRSKKDARQKIDHRQAGCQESCCQESACQENRRQENRRQEGRRQESRGEKGRGAKTSGETVRREKSRDQASSDETGSRQGSSETARQTGVGPTASPSPKSATRKRVAEVPVKHISPEEAVAHIQALLEARQERVRQGPSWPGAEAAPVHGNHDVHALGSSSPGLPSEAAHGHGLAHERGEQSKRKG